MIESPQFLILLLLTTTSVCMDAEWSVTYGPAQHICALEGSSIIMQCTYTYPLDLKVKDVHWVNQDMEDPVDFPTDADYSDRFRVTCEHKRCFLQLTNVSLADALQQYQCKITTNRKTESYIGEPGISLSVTGLQIVPSKNKNIRNGDLVTFTCATTCDLPGNPSFVWAKDGRLLVGENDKQMVLGPVHLDNDVGIYSCAVTGYGDIFAASLSLEIQTNYPKLEWQGTKQNFGREDNISGDGQSDLQTAGIVILGIVSFGFVFGLMFLRYYFCIRSCVPPRPATVGVTVLSVVTPTRPSNFEAWRNPGDTQPLVSDTQHQF